MFPIFPRRARFKHVRRRCYNLYLCSNQRRATQKKLQLCVDNVHYWYHIYRLTITKKKSAVMVIGSKAQLQSPNLDQFSINLESNQIELVNKAKYLGLLVKGDLSWDDHILQLCMSMNYSLQWRHNGHDGVSNHQPHDCLLNRLFRRRSKKISKLRVTGRCAGNSPVTGEFNAQMASNAENVSIWWRHHATYISSKGWTSYSRSNYLSEFQILYSTQISLWTLNLGMYNWGKSWPSAKNSKFLCKDRL